MADKQWVLPDWATTPNDRLIKAVANRRWQRAVEFSRSGHALDGQIRALLAEREAGRIVGRVYGFAARIR